MKNFCNTYIRLVRLGGKLNILKKILLNKYLFSMTAYGRSQEQGNSK